ncbi:MAG: hypothetical protein J2P36_31625, partial [Ktedonobacteraceae bacterium]|nr:hypothetical protein [Ktedonobacteraceae bacterium]
RHRYVTTSSALSLHIVARRQGDSKQRLLVTNFNGINRTCIQARAIPAGLQVFLYLQALLIVAISLSFHREMQTYTTRSSAA